MKLQFLLAGIVATGLFASAPDTVAHGGFGGGGGHGGGGFHGGGGGFHGGRFGEFRGARFGGFRGARFGDFHGGRFGDFHGGRFGDFRGRHFGEFHGARFGEFRDHRVFFQQFAWPIYWYPYYPYDYSYLDYGPDNNYQYWDSSAASVQPESFRPAVDHGPVVVVINTGNSRPMDSRANTAYVNSGYSSTDAEGQQRIVNQDPNEKIGTRADPGTYVPPAVPKPAQTAAKSTQRKPPAQAGAFGNLVLVSWLEDAGKDVIYVQNTETNDVQKITYEPNLDNFRIVELHPNADPKLFEAVISNGSQQGPVRFRF
jgi:hypothetical protein